MLHRPVPVEEFKPGTVRGCLRALIASPDEGKGALLNRFSAKRLRKGGLADSRLAADKHQSSAAGKGESESLAKHGEFAVPPDERRERRWSGRVHPTPEPNQKRTWWEDYI